MDLKTFLRSLPNDDAREQFAVACETTPGHLRNVCYGKSCGPALAVAIERETGKKVRRWELRAEDWHLIWPELIGRKGAPSVNAAAKQEAL